MTTRIDVTFSEAAIDGNTLSGIAHVFGKRALVQGRYEAMDPKAFDRVLKDPTTDVRAFFNHKPEMLLGRQGAGTLRVGVEDGALSFSVDLPDTSYANDLRALVARGDLNGASFGFLPDKFTLTRAEDGREVRTHTEIARFMDVSPVSLPAFDGTNLQLHSEETAETLSSQLIRARYRARFLSA